MKNQSIEMRTRLCNGETIDDVCREYNISFGDLVFLMMGLNSQRRNHNTRYNSIGYKYIREVVHIPRGKTRYVIKKRNKLFGTYSTLEDAIKVRDWFICHRWDNRWVDKACRETGVERCKR